MRGRGGGRGCELEGGERACDAASSMRDSSHECSDGARDGAPPDLGDMKAS